MYSGFWRRFAAAFIDGIIVSIASAVISGVLSVVVIGVAASRGPGAGATVLLVQILIGMFGQWLYYALLESSSNQATLGKMVFGIKVVNEAGERIGFGRATGRFFGKFVSSLTLCIGYLMAAFTDKKQALHDMIASTYVVYREVEPMDFERGYYDGQPRLSGLVVAIGVIAGLFVPIFFVGILAAVSIPAYQDYTIRAQVTEGISLATQAKTQVVQWEAGARRWPVSAAEINLAPPNGAHYVEELRVSNGTITVVYGKGANKNLLGQTLSLQPMYTRSGQVFWRCGHAAVDRSSHFVAREGQKPSDDSAGGTTVPDKYLPSSCRESRAGR
jgi:uncharacterized RDD family membrane protein YckC